EELLPTLNEGRVVLWTSDYVEVDIGVGSGCPSRVGTTKESSDDKWITGARTPEPLHGSHRGLAAHLVDHRGAKPAHGVGHRRRPQGATERGQLEIRPAVHAPQNRQEDASQQDVDELGSADSGTVGIDACADNHNISLCRCGCPDGVFGKCMWHREFVRPLSHRRRFGVPPVVSRDEYTTAD